MSAWKMLINACVAVFDPFMGGTAGMAGRVLIVLPIAAMIFFWFLSLILGGIRRA